jgi:maltooligosyltrehalose trehalohydrolase
MTALLLLSPGTPMLFQGQEFAASSRFLYFADHNPELAKEVAAGREEFLKQFPSLDNPEARKILQNPESIETFMGSKLNFADKEDHRPVFELHRDLIRLRRNDPVIGRASRRMIDGAVLQNESLVIRYFGQNGDDRLLLVNLGKHLQLNIAPEPILAPPMDKKWKQVWNSEDIRYGGNGMPAPDLEGAWQFPGQVAVLLKAVSEEDERE